MKYSVIFVLAVILSASATPSVSGNPQHYNLSKESLKVIKKVYLHTYHDSYYQGDEVK